MDRRLTFDLFDACPDQMERFVEALRDLGGRPLPIDTGSDGSTLHLNAEVAATETAPVEYSVILAPAPDYQRCVMVLEEGSKALIDGAVHERRSAAFRDGRRREGHGRRRGTAADA